ncbi:MAG: hypothetical protein BroJett040_15320 [Oligoflexia bacterium]|nr:MAG: hypothetical protein BroJett040_15320 [Oligoflexia bacterium]
MKILCFFFLFIFLVGPVYGQKLPAPIGKIIVEEALIYSEADFDSPVIARLQGGGSYPVSQKKFGAFHRIRLKDGKIGYISDVDFRVMNRPQVKQNQSAQRPKKEGVHFEDEVKTSKRSFASARYRGPEFVYVNYREDTMSLKPTEGMWFVGLKLTGADTLLEGDIVTDVNFLFKIGAPNYYQQATGNSANGWIMILDSLFQMPTAHSQNVLTSFGFGPMFKYSKFNVTLNQAGGGQNSYSLEDMVLGLAFNINLGYKINSMAIKGEWKYYWEKMQYQAYGLALQFEF